LQQQDSVEIRYAINITMALDDDKDKRDGRNFENNNQ